MSVPSQGQACESTAQRSKIGLGIIRTHANSQTLAQAAERHRTSRHQTTSVAPVTLTTVETSRSARRASTEGPPIPKRELEQTVVCVRHQRQQPPPSKHGKLLKRWECRAVERSRTSMHQQPQGAGHMDAGGVRRKEGCSNLSGRRPSRIGKDDPGR